MDSNITFEAMQTEITLLRQEVKELKTEVQMLNNRLITQDKNLQDVAAAFEPDIILDKELEYDTEPGSTLSTRAFNILKRESGIEVYRDLTYLSEKDILAIRNCGKTTLHEIIDFCEKFGITLGQPAPEFDPGEAAIMRIPIPYYNLPAGEVVIVIKKAKAFLWERIARYECRMLNGVTFYTSVGTLKKANS